MAKKRDGEPIDFNMKAVLTRLRHPAEKSDSLVKSYNWYPDAVLVDALLPPSIPLSAKEICAYYPHHVRWQDVMLRLSQNDYRGADLLGMQAVFRGPCQVHMSPAILNQIQRDALRIVLPDFKTSDYKGKGDTNAQTDSLTPGQYLEKKLKGYTAPSFDDLLRGLKCLPHGEDALGLTQCLVWYLTVCDSFNPRLDINTLHTLALLRALRQPSVPIMSQNLDKTALNEWKETGTLRTTQAVGVGHHETSNKGGDGCAHSKSQAVFSIHSDQVKLEMYVQIPIRHVLTFPFLALHGVVSEALQLGIDIAERRRAARKSATTPQMIGNVESDRTKDDSKVTSKRFRETPIVEELPQMRTSKLQQRLYSSTEVCSRGSPKRPTVSPITPRTSKKDQGQTPANNSRLSYHLESSPLEHYTT